jgi:hypothetical protein
MIQILHTLLCSTLREMGFLIDFKCKESEAKKRYKAGKEFYEIERSAIVMDIGEYLWITYFSSIKSFVTSQLLVLSLIKKVKHKSIQMEYNSFINMRN